MRAVLRFITAALLFSSALLLALAHPAQSSDPLQRMVPIYAYLHLHADSAGDGVRNGTDQCPTTPVGAVVDATGCSQGTMTATALRTSMRRRSTERIRAGQPRTAAGSRTTSTTGSGRILWPQTMCRPCVPRTSITQGER